MPRRTTVARKTKYQVVPVNRTSSRFTAKASLDSSIQSDELSMSMTSLKRLPVDEAR